jgi:hypothetical protein
LFGVDIMAGMTAIDLVIWFLVLFRGVSYWLLSALRNPGESQSVQALYRAGDMEYFPLIQALARGNWGEFALLEPVSHHLGSFPLASIALHSFFYKLFGVIGFPIADLIATMLYFWLLVKVLRLFQVSKLAAQAVALLVVSGALNQLVSVDRKVSLTAVNKWL